MFTKYDNRNLHIQESQEPSALRNVRSHCCWYPRPVCDRGSERHTATGPPNLSYKGTITMYTAIGPADRWVQDSPRRRCRPEMQTAANAFEKMYPNIKIQFMPPTANSAGYSSGRFFISEAAAGSLPDVTWVPGYYVNVTLPNGLFQDLTPSFQQPNPFIPGNTKWINTMSSVAHAQGRASWGRGFEVIRLASPKQQGGYSPGPARVRDNDSTTTPSP